MMDNQLRYYLRYHPHWYLILSRYPQEYSHLIQEYRDEKNQHFIDKIEQSINVNKYGGDDVINGIK